MEGVGVELSGRVEGFSEDIGHSNVKIGGPLRHHTQNINDQTTRLFLKSVRQEANKTEKEKDFDFAVYQYHVKCNNEESRIALEKSFENMSIGLIGVVVGVIFFNPGSCFLIYDCSKKIWLGVQQFKEACRLSHQGLDDVTFVTDGDSYRNNTEAEQHHNGSMLTPWTPLDPMKPLDPTFRPFR